MVLSSVGGQGKSTQSMKRPLLEDTQGQSQVGEQNQQGNAKTMGVLAAGTLFGAVIGAGLATLLANPSFAPKQKAVPMAESQHSFLQLAEQPLSEQPLSNLWKEEDTVEQEPPKQILDHDSAVGPVKLRFDNRCFWEQQKKMQNLLMSDYVSKLMSAQVEKTEVTSTQTAATSDASAESLYAMARPALSKLKSSALAFQQHCEKWVAQTTDATWHAFHEKDRNDAIDKYFAKDFVSHIFGYSVGGHRAYSGGEELKTMIKAKLHTFPDLKIRILNTICTPAVHDQLGLLGFFTTMPDLSEGTMHGEMNLTLPQEDGSTVNVVIPPSHQRVAYPGNAVTFVAPDAKTGRWQYQGEWVMHGEMEMFAQMNALGKIAPHASGTARKIVDEIAPKVEGCRMPHLWYGGDVWYSDLPSTKAKAVKTDVQA